MRNTTGIEVKNYLWEPILKEAYIMDKGDLLTIISQIPVENANIKAMLNQISKHRFGTELPDKL